MTEKDIENIENVFRTHGSSARLLNGYGECECGVTVTTDITNKKFSNDASGIPLPRITTIGIFNDEYTELKYGERGNILVKTEIGMLEYYKNSQATKEFFYYAPNGDRWNKTGDIGYVNDDGSLVVLGRKSDISIINGFKIYNFDIERAILKSDKVKLCEIQTNPKDENRLVAHIVWENDIKEFLKTHPDKTEEYLQELQTVARKELNIEAAIPESFCIWESFPSAHSGKRDISFIKNTVDNLIRIRFEKIK